MAQIIFKYTKDVKFYLKNFIFGHSYKLSIVNDDKIIIIRKMSKSVKTRQDDDPFGIGLPQPDFHGSKEPNGRQGINVLTFHLTDNLQGGLDHAVDATAKLLET